MSSLARVASRLVAREPCTSSRSCFGRKLSIKATHASARRAEPLRILFCGSDDFSVAHLKSLVDFWKRDKLAVESIDVVCRTDKRVGPGLKILNEVPIKKTAKEIGLPIHQLDAFRILDAEKLHGKINLVVAVSFGLLIPARVIESAKYGGLNVHPSLLPDLRGAAPIHYAILNQRQHTGVSIQTLHPTKFDHGQILAQTPLPGLAVPPNATPKELLPVLAEEGVRLLRHVIEEELYIPPFEPVVHSQDTIDQLTGGKGLAKAPKILKADSEIHWDAMTAAEIVLRLRTFGRLWDITAYRQIDSRRIYRVVYDSLADVSADPDLAGIAQHRRPAGIPFIVPLPDGSDVRVLVLTKERGLIEIRDCTIAGKSRTNGAGLRELKRVLAKEPLV